MGRRGTAAAGHRHPGNPGAGPRGVDAAGAASDALLGLAADALAVGRLAEARGLVARAEAGLAGLAPLRSWRARVRHGWVCAELALAAGDPAAARAPAQAAAELAREQRATRHLVKSEIVLAVVLQTLAGTTSGTHSDDARRLLSSALATAKARQWHSLTWPAAFATAQVDQDLREYGDAVLHGVLQRTDPVGREIAFRSPWVPRVADDPAPPMDADIWGKNFEKKATGSCQGSAESVR